MTTTKMKSAIFSLLICFVGFTHQSGTAQENQKTNDSIKLYTIENCVNQFSMDKTVKTSVGYQYWFADKEFIDGQTLKMSVVAPFKSTHSPHKHIEDEFFFVLEGTANFYLDGNSITIGPNTSLYCPSMQMHGISNAGDTQLKYLVIKKYQKNN
jgi:mannose-6-phosphate isomerase-like protein (cupin superfamily)